MNKNDKNRQEDKAEIKGSIESLKEESNKKRREDKEDKEKLDKNIEPLKKDITEKIDGNGKKLEIFQEENKKLSLIHI